MQTIEELKAHAYDCIANKELWEKELRATNDLIIKMSKEKEGVTGTEAPTTSETTGTNEPKE